MIEQLVTLTLGLVLAYAGIRKLEARRTFLASVLSWGLTGKFADRTSWVLPILEIAVGVSAVNFALASWHPRLALSALAVTFAVFVVGQIALLAARKRADCGCFGKRSQINRWTVGRTALRSQRCRLPCSAFRCCRRPSLRGVAGRVPHR